MQMNNQQLNAYLTAPQSQFVPDNYVPVFVQAETLVDHPIIQQCAPIVAVLAIQRVQQTLQQQPSHFSMATFNLLAENNYQNVRFRATVRILLTGLKNIALSNQSVASQLQAYLPTYVADYLSGALGMMFQQLDQLRAFFSPQIQNAILQEAQRMTGILSANMGVQNMNNGNGVNVGDLMSGGNVGVVGASGGNFLNLAPAEGAAPQRLFDAQQANRPVETSITINAADDFYTRLNKRERAAKEGLELIDLSKPQVEDAVIVEPTAAPAPEAARKPTALSMLAGGPEGVTLVSTNRESLNLDQALLEENAMMLRSNHATLREEAAEPEWDGTWVPDSEFKDLIRTAEATGTTEQVQSMAAEFFKDDTEGEEMSGFPGITRDGRAVLKPQFRENNDKAKELLDQAPSLSFADLFNTGKKWYPFHTQETLPYVDSKTQELRFYPILAQDGLFAALVPKEETSIHMDYEAHGIGYLPRRARLAEPVKVEAPAETTGAEPKVFRIKPEIAETITQGSSFARMYHDGIKVFSEKDTGDDERTVCIQGALVTQAFGFDTEEEMLRAKGIVEAIASAKDLLTVAQQLELLESDDEIPLRQYISGLFGKQVTRLLRHRILVDIETDELTVDVWETILNYANNNFPDTILKAFTDSEEMIIKEVCGAFTALVDEEFQLSMLDTLDLEEGSNQGKCVLFFGTYEQVMFAPFIAGQLELMESSIGFLIPEQAHKLHTMAKTLLGLEAKETYQFTANVIITRDGYRIDVARSPVVPDSILGWVERIPT